MPSFAQLERFVTSVQLGSFAAAASKLYLSPQTVSKSVHDLEREWKVQLFKPGLHTLTITPVGKSVFLHAADIMGELHQIDQLVDQGMESKVQSGPLRIAVCSSPLRGNRLQAKDFAAFQKLYPQVKLSISFHSSSVCLEMLASGVVDAAIVIGQPEDASFSFAKVSTCSLCLLVSSKNALSNRHQISFNDLVDVPIAFPYDFGYCYHKIVDKALSRGVSLGFEALEMRLDNHSAFLQERLGGIFVCANRELETIHPDTKLLSFKSEDRVVAPHYFVWQNNSANQLVGLMGKYLRLRCR